LECLVVPLVFCFASSICPRRICGDCFQDRVV
jgi:hypothetical protein